MRGEILTFDPATGFGAVSGDDGQRYSLTREGLKTPASPVAGQRVDFTPEGGMATDVFILTPVHLQPAPHMKPDLETLSLWGYFKRAVRRKYVDGHGRARRKEYWGFVLFWALLSFGPILLGMTIGAVGDNADIPALEVVAMVPLGIGILIYFGLLIPAITVRIRRFHDVGLSGWLILLNAIPYAGELFVFVVTVLPSQKRANVHGPIPGQALVDVAATFD